MTLQEFAALKVGDEIDNLQSGSNGKITSVTPSGVNVTWGANAMSFFYSVQSTAWMSWTKA